MTTEKSEAEVGIDQEKSTAIAGASASRQIAHTDTDRINALAEAMNHLIVYETSSRGEKFKIEFRSNHIKGKKRHGVSPAFLRMIADGILRAAGGS